jgi:hypothetical protein
MVRLSGLWARWSPWHEVKLGIVGGWTGTRPEADLEAPSYVAAREGSAVCASSGRRSCSAWSTLRDGLLSVVFS